MCKIILIILCRCSEYCDCGNNVTVEDCQSAPTEVLVFL